MAGVVLEAGTAYRSPRRPGARVTELAVSRLSRDEARSLTDEVKLDAERLWRKLVELYDGGAHLALGYSSWGGYFKTEFGQSERHGYRLLEAGRALEVVSDQLVTPANEGVARELAPLLNEPDVLREAWAEASTNGTPTAARVREVVAHCLRFVTPGYTANRTVRSPPTAASDGASRMSTPGYRCALPRSWQLQPWLDFLHRLRNASRASCCQREGSCFETPRFASVGETGDTPLPVSDGRPPPFFGIAASACQRDDVAFEISSGS